MNRLHRADLPDNTGTRDLDERTIAGTDNMRIRALVAHRAIIDNIGAPVRTEPEVGRAVEAVDVGRDERLVAGAIAGKVLDLERERSVRQLVEVDQLDLMTDYRGG